MEQVLHASPRSVPADGLNVLVVDDSSTNRLILTRMLEALGHKVETAPDGERAVLRTSDRLFDLVLMDVQMPGIGGIEAARQIRALGGAAASTPIVAVTADTSDSDRAAYVAVGMEGVVSKPLTPANLQAEIARVAVMANPG